MSFKELKKKARHTLKKHYIILVIILLLAAFLGTSHSSMLDLFKARDLQRRGNVLIEVLSGNLSAAQKLANDNASTLSQTTKQLGIISFGHQNGIFAELINAYSSGSFWITMLIAINSIIDSGRLSGFFVVLIGLLIINFEIIFVSEEFRIIYSRILLESRIYKKINISSLMFLIRVKKYCHIGVQFLLVNIRLFLWNLTIVGGIIKHFSYALVPYILAENPNLNAKEAVKLSSSMMNGHKWELFLLKLSFIGWKLLSLFSFGLLEIFYFAPYYESTLAEYYVYIRNESKNKGLEDINLLNDTYLYEIAPIATIDTAYSEIIKEINEPDISLHQPSRLRAFIQNYFGLVLYYDSAEIAYRKHMSTKLKAQTYKDIVEEKAYPSRLCPIKTAEKREVIEHVYYMRHYSLCSIIAIFFTFCTGGWLWEVSIHLVNDHAFVNRGMLHGPWIPIYGVGAVLILLLLYSLRHKPWLEFIMAIVLSGVVEYFTHFFVEKITDGKKWWDYTGYFLNINGRVCGEGLLVFGLAGVTAVYFIAPLLDNLFSRISRKILVPICAILTSIFIFDTIFSHFVPNEGKGINDYARIEKSISADKESLNLETCKL